jgi:hypothetical protein
MANRSSFLISLSLHLFGAVFLFVFLHAQQLPVLVRRSVLIEIAQAPRQSSKSASSQTSSKSKPTHAPPSFQLKDLGVKYGWQLQVRPYGGPNAEPNPARESDRGQLNSSDVVKEGKESPLFRLIRDQVENHLAYPAELKEKGIQGTVTGAVVFSKGQFVEDQTRLQSDSAYLRVAVMRALRKAFRESLPEKYWQLASDREGRLEVQCRFIFETVEHDEEKKSHDLQAVSGHALAFYRTYVHSALQWQLGPLSGLGPLVSLNVLWLPEKIGELFSKKAEIDPLDSYRDDPAW